MREQTPQIPVSTYDYTVYGDGRAEWEEYPHGANEFVRGDYVRTEDADSAYAALSARCTALEQERDQLQQEVERRNIAVVEQHVAKALMDQVHRAEAAEAALDTAKSNALALNDLCASQIEEKINLRSRCQHLEQENAELKGRIANALL